MRMKKIFLGLIATLFAISLNAQNFGRMSRFESNEETIYLYSDGTGDYRLNGANYGHSLTWSWSRGIKSRSGRQVSPAKITITIKMSYGDKTLQGTINSTADGEIQSITLNGVSWRKTA